MGHQGRSRLRSRLQPLSHVLAGLLILLESTTAYGHHRPIGAALFLLGVLFIATAILHRKVEPLVSIHGQQVLHLLESVTLAVVAYLMITEHKHYLPYAYVLASFMYLAAAFVYGKRHQRHTGHR